MQRARVGIFGASGYTGAELVRLVAGHGQLELAHIAADRSAGQPLDTLFPHLLHDRQLVSSTIDDMPELDLAFLALPHRVSADTGRALALRGVAVVDLSADWRLKSADSYASWYGTSHPHPNDLSKWCYGLVEHNRATITKSRQIANPGCYPTATLLALLPVIGQVGNTIVVNAASGVSGAGRKSDLAYSFSEVDGSFSAYNVGTHRHTPEIEQELSLSSKRPVIISFTPHLLPIARGMLATCVVQGDYGVIRGTLEDAYANETFVHVMPEGVQPSTKWCTGSNRAFIGIGGDKRNDNVVITCAIDNLGKGAAGQALQNANLVLGFPETTGLEAVGIFP